MNKRKIIKKGETPQEIQDYLGADQPPHYATDAAGCGWIYSQKGKLSLLPKGNKEIATISQQLIESFQGVPFSGFTAALYLSEDVGEGSLEIQWEEKQLQETIHYVEMHFTITDEKNVSTTRTVAYPIQEGETADSTIQKAIDSQLFERDLLLAKAQYYREE